VVYEELDEIGLLRNISRNTDVIRRILVFYVVLTVLSVLGWLLIVSSM
jgi:hypothetical protein